MGRVYGSFALGCWIAALSGSIPIGAQTGCPGISFYTARQTILFDPSKNTFFGVAQITPPSYMGGGFSSVPPFSRQSMLLDFQRTLLGCLPQPPGIAGPAIAAPISAAPGTASQELAVGFFSNGLPGLVYVNPFAGGGGFVQVLMGSSNLSSARGPSYNAGPGAYAVLLADFNGDHIPDLAVVNRGASNSVGNVSIYPGNGDGTFKARIDSPAGQNPASMAAFDLNGDGKLDLAVANAGSNNVSILSGKGDGTFQAPVNLAVGTAPSSVAVADLNADGRPDLIVANADSNDFSVLLGNAGGSFQAAVPYAAGTSPSYVATGDFNRDGIPDIAVANRRDSTVSIRLGKGDGSFGRGVNYHVSTRPGALVLADVNGDGRLDVVVGLGSPGAFGPDLTSGPPSSNVNSNAVAILLGNGDGTFQGEANYPLNNGTINGGYPGAQAIAAADFNGDGFPDLATINIYNLNVSILVGSSTGAFQQGPTMDLGVASRSGPTSVVAGDFNQDGAADLVVAIDNQLVVLFGNGDGTFQPASPYRIPNYPGGYSYLLAADFNGDGVTDLAVAWQCCWTSFSPTLAANVGIFLGNGDGTFTAASFNAGLDPAGLAAGDFNGDGIVDLAVVDGGNAQEADGAVYIALGNGDGSFQTPVQYAAGTNPRWIGVGDLNGDGFADLVVSNRGGAVMLFNNGDGTFAPQQTLTRDFVYSVAVADVNGDGKADVVLARQISPTIDILAGKGDGTFEAPVSYPAGGFFVAPFQIADFNQDGKPDIAVVGTPQNGTGSVSVLINAGVR